MFLNDMKEIKSESHNTKDEDEFRGQPEEKSSTPITPKMLIKALKMLKKSAFKGLFFSPKEVANEILKICPSVEQDFQILLLEVSDKLACAAAAGLVGMKQDLGYYAFDFRQDGVGIDSRSELMFWVLYKKVLNRKMEEVKKKDLEEKKENSSWEGLSKAVSKKNTSKIISSSAKIKKVLR